MVKSRLHSFVVLFPDITRAGPARNENGCSLHTAGVIGSSPVVPTKNWKTLYRCNCPLPSYGFTIAGDLSVKTSL
jgi:hypothetical protein